MLTLPHKGENMELPLIMVVLTSKNLQSMILENGCGHWKASADSIMRCRYLVATRNKRSTWVQGDEDHGTAFLVGEISGVIAVEDRYVVQMARYAEVNIPNVWEPKGSNPVRYEHQANLPIDFDSLDWKPWPTSEESSPEKVTAKSRLTIAEAKLGLAETFGVEPDQIEILIRA